MKALIATLVSVFALSAFAVEPAKTAEVKPAVVSTPAPVVAKKDEKKPVKSEGIADPKATATPAKPAASK